MPLDFTNQHRIRIDGQDVVLYSFTTIPRSIEEAGIAPEVKDATQASGPPQPQRAFLFETVSFSCDIGLDVGGIYDYISPENKHRKLKILTAGKNKYRGVFH